MLVDYSDSESDEQPPPAPEASERAATSNHNLNLRKGNPPKNPCAPGSVRSLALPQATTPPLPPPLPASFHALYATNVRGAVSDDPSLHGGRARQVAHVEGNWPSHIFLEWIPAVDELRKLEHVLLKACRRRNREPRNFPVVHSLLRSELNVPLPLHISLSAPLTLKTEQKDAVAAAVEAEVSKSGARSFAVSPTRLCWVSNSEGTRSFLVLKLTRPENDDLNRVLKACNASVGRFGLKTLYCCCSSPSSPSQRASSTTAPKLDAVSDDTSDAFHVSIAWTLGDVEIIRRGSADRRHVEDEDGDDGDDNDDDDDDDITSLQIEFDTVKLKIGNVVKDILLRPSLSAPPTIATG